MSTTIKPVTQADDVDVNRASKNGVPTPSREEMGSIKKMLPSKIINTYPITIICVCVSFLYNNCIINPSSYSLFMLLLLLLMLHVPVKFFHQMHAENK